MADTGRVACPVCRRDVGCFVPRGGDGTGMRVRNHREPRSHMQGSDQLGECVGSRRIVTHWRDNAAPAGDLMAALKASIEHAKRARS